MPQDSNQHNRKSIRLRNYDYTQPGAYFITICTLKRVRLFGGIIDGEMHLNLYGKIVQETWHDLPKHYSNIELDTFVVMPNHIHAVVMIEAYGVGAVPKGQPHSRF